jgi:hypothetical protein
MPNYQSPLLNLYQFDYDIPSLNTIYSYESIISHYYIVDSSNSNLIPSFNNDVLDVTLLKEKEIPCITDVMEYNDDNITTDISAQLSLFVINNGKIKIPSKVEYVIRKYLPRKSLKEIHKDIDVAIELCLLFCMQLNSTYFEIKNGSNPEGWKSLRAEYLREFLCLSPMTYKKVITALEQPMSRGAILECDHISVIGEKNHFYRLSQQFLGKGIVSYNLKTKEAKSLLNRHYYRTMSKAQKNPICENLIRFYQDITLPSIDQIKREANRLIKLDYTTKKRKKLAKLNKHPRSYFKNPEKLSFVEDAIEIFQYLTDNGLLIPTVGSEASGGRVVDSFTLMPSWIRRMVQVNGKLHGESDYNCLHPNIIVKLYGGSLSNLTHGDVGLALNIPVDEVKIEHLSFFNKEVWQMKRSPLYPYYLQNEPKMINAIITEKHQSKFRHKITSRRLFGEEVEVMTAVVKQLNEEGIFVGYVYDALFFHPSNGDRVKKIMDSVIQRFEIYTTAKLSSGKKHNPFIATHTETKLDTASLKCNLADEVCINVDARAINFSDRIKRLLLERISNGEQLDFVDANIIFGENDVARDKVLRINDSLNPTAVYVTQSHILRSA